MCYNLSCSAGVAHPVERHLAKVEVASSSLVTRSKKHRPHFVVCVFLFGDDGSKIDMQSSGGRLLADGLDGGENVIFREGENANEPRHLPSMKMDNCEN